MTMINGRYPAAAALMRYESLVGQALTTETESEPQQQIRRINVAVNSDELAALKLLIERERISLTEAVAAGDHVGLGAADVFSAPPKITKS